MAWQVRHQGSPTIRKGLSLAQVVRGLQDGIWETTDEVLGPGESQWVPIENHPQLEEIAQEVEPPLYPTKHEDETKLDMNALIDVCLVLLIFFILTMVHASALQKMVFIPPPLDPDLKTGKIKIMPSQVKKYMVEVTAIGGENNVPTITVAGDPVDVFDEDKNLDKEKLKNILQPLLQKNKSKTEMLLDCRNVSWKTVINIQDAGKAAGFRRINYKTQATPKTKTK